MWEERVAVNPSCVFFAGFFARLASVSVIWTLSILWRWTYVVYNLSVCIQVLELCPLALPARLGKGAGAEVGVWRGKTVL